MPRNLQMPVYNLSEHQGKEAELSTTVCVVGAGLAGLIAALRLARMNRATIVVIESGGKEFNSEVHKLNQFDNAFDTYRHGIDGRYRGLGGSSTQWGGKLLPLAAGDTASRPHVDLAAWPLKAEELAGYGADIEAIFGIDSDTYEEAILDRVDRERLTQRNDQDFTLRYPKWPAFRSCNLATVLGPKIKETENLQVWLGATVCGFDFDPETRRLRTIRATSLDGRLLRVDASEFLFAAGTIETTRLLLLLDQASSGRAFPRCEVLGRYFQDHLGAKVADLIPREREWTNRVFGYYFIGSTRRSQHLELSPAAQAASGVASGFAHVTMAPRASSPMLVLKKLLRGMQNGRPKLNSAELKQLLANPQALLQGAYWRFVRKQLFWPADTDLQLNVWIEQLPCWENRIVLSDERDALGVPMARIEWRPMESEERTFQACVAHLQDYWRRHGLAAKCEMALIPGVRDKSVPIVSLADDRHHPSGSTRMGDDPAKSVVRPDLRTHEIENLTVASASVFPTAGSANPTYAILQVAMHAAETLIQKYL